MLDLEARWTQLWDELGSHSLPFSVVEGIYTAPHRTGFALAHLTHCFNELDAAKGQVSAHNAAALELSIWFQNLLLYPGEVDCTEEMFALIEQWLKRHARDPYLVTAVRRLIVNGRFLDIFAWTHMNKMGGWDVALLHDLNYSELGKSPMQFKEVMRRYEARLDRAGVPFPTITIRTALWFCYHQPVIFVTSYFREKYELPTRAHIEAYFAA